MRYRFHLILVLVLVMLAAGQVSAQWTTQTIPLQPGWNAVHLQVQPEPADCDAAFAGIPAESVWLWNRRYAPVQFIQDPATLVPTNANWLIYLPPAHPDAGQTTLFRLTGGKCYLIRLPDTASPTNWVVHGRPVTTRTTWLTDSLNLVGFSVDAQSPPTYREFFGPSAAHSAAIFYRLRTDGYWEQVPLPTVTRMTDGRAIWLKSLGSSTYQGPVDVMLEQRTGLEFGHVLNEQTLVIRNAGTDTKTLVVRQLASEPPPSGESFPPLAGEVPLSYWYSSDTVPGVWTNLPATLTRKNVAPGAEWRLRLAVRRADMSSPPSTSSELEPLYQSLLEVTESAGTRRHVIPVSAYGMRRPPTAQVSSPMAYAKGAATDVLHAGLWVGNVVINKVNQPTLASDPDTPLPTAFEFQFRIVLHVDDSGQVRLLQKVLQMWKNGTLKPDPDDPTKEIVDVPGRFVLLTDETRAAAYSGATLRDGEPVGRRFSTAAFSFRQPLPMSGFGDFGVDGSKFIGTTILDYQDPLNPFVHRYHPDHNNLNESYDEANPLPPGRESFTISRKITLQFTAGDPEHLQLPGWGSSQLGGLYRETITGLHQAALNVEGTFRIHLASDVAVLNDGALQ